MNKTIGAFLLVTIIAVPVQAQSQAKFWLGGSGTVLFMNATGEVSDGGFSADFDATTSFLDPANDEIGFAWDNKILFGFKPTAGVKFNDQFGVSIGYALYSTKEGDETDSYSDAFYDIQESFASEWSQKSWQLLAQFYPSSSNPGLSLLAGVEFVSLDLQGAYFYEEYDYNSGSYYSEAFAFDGSGSASGFMFGLGYDFTPAKNMTFYGTATYSLAKYDDTDLFEGDLNLDVKVGGFAAELGLKFFPGQ